MDMLPLPPDRWAREPISVPRHPFWAVLRRFGRDEIIAAIINVLGTAVAAAFTSNPLFLALAGPVIEKVGFFPAHFWEALGVYRTTPTDQRQGLWFYCRHALAGGAVSLAEDVLVHDPCYTILMLVGLGRYPGTPVWLLAAGSFAAAVVIVSILETTVTEVGFALLKSRLRRAGFGSESYFEARFLIGRENSADPTTMLADLARKLELSEPRRLEYRDTYMGHTFPSYSGRQAKVRLRNRTTDDDGTLRSLQVVYTRACEMVPQRFDQCRFFPIRKEKLYYPLDGERQPPEAAGRLDPERDVVFTRMVANNPQLLLSMDIVKDDRPFHVLELKTHRDVRAMVSAMRMIMRTLPVLQTTRGKSDLLSAA